MDDIDSIKGGNYLRDIAMTMTTPDTATMNHLW
jgi:hypothetical protein